MSKPEIDLERRALLGDQEAQEECAKLGIALPCPCCGSSVIVNEIPPHKHALATFMPDYEGGCFIECPSCNYANCGKTKQEALMNHNRRPTPPVVHAHWVHLGGDKWACSSCGFVICIDGSWENPPAKHCLDCGAKMDKEAPND